MEILYFSTARIPSEKAHTKQIIKMCEAMGKNHEVTLVIPKRKQIKRKLREADPYEFYGVEKSFEIRRLPCIDTLPLTKDINNSFIKTFLFYYPIIYSFALSSFIYLLKSGADISYYRSFIPFLFCLPVTKIKGVKTIYGAHQFPKSWIGQYITIRLLMLSNKIIVVSENLKKLFVEGGIPNDRVIVAPNGIDLEKFKPDGDREEAKEKIGVPKDKNIICYTGQLWKRKGVYTLVDAMMHLSDEYLLLLVGGMPEDIEKMNNYVEEKGIKNIQIEGYIEPHRVPRYLHASDVAVLPNLPAAEDEISEKKYTSPLKLFEYMASKTPIVASDHPPIREILKDRKNALLVKPGDPKSLADGIKRIMADNELAEDLTVQAYQEVQKYSWTNRAEKILNSLIDN